MFRETDIRKLTMLYLRQYWSVTKSLTLSVAYRLVYCSLTPLHTPLADLFAFRLKQKLLALIPWTYGSALKYLRDHYSEQIDFEYLGANETVWLAPDDASNDVWLTSTTADPVYLTPNLESVSGINILIIRVPQSLMDDSALYSQFLADLNTLILDGITYKIKAI